MTGKTKYAKGKKQYNKKKAYHKRLKRYYGMKKIGNNYINYGFSRGRQQYKDDTMMKFYSHLSGYFTATTDVYKNNGYLTINSLYDPMGTFDSDMVKNFDAFFCLTNENLAPYSEWLVLGCDMKISFWSNSAVGLAMAGYSVYNGLSEQPASNMEELQTKENSQGRVVGRADGGNNKITFHKYWRLPKLFHDSDTGYMNPTYAYNIDYQDDGNTYMGTSESDPASQMRVALITGGLGGANTSIYYSIDLVFDAVCRGLVDRQNL